MIESYEKSLCCLRLSGSGIVGAQTPRRLWLLHAFYRRKGLALGVKQVGELGEEAGEEAM